jgi:small basic protein (TIGR04137 family)
MSLDRSLKVASGMGQHRNVLTRAERISKLTESGRFRQEMPIHLPKVGNRKLGGKKGATKKEEGAAEGAAAPAAGAAKAAAPAAGKATAAKGAAKK